MNSFNCFKLWGLKEIDHPKENHPSFEIGRGKEACLLHELEVVFSLSATILLFTKEGGFGWKQTWLHSKCQRKHEEVKTHLFLSMCMCVCVCVCKYYTIGWFLQFFVILLFSLSPKQSDKPLADCMHNAAAGSVSMAMLSAGLPCCGWATVSDPHHRVKF